MRALDNADFLALWETGHGLHPLDRGLLALRVSLADGFDADGESVADWPLGRRNRALAEVRSLYFGPHLQGWSACERCGEKLEFNLDCRTLVEHSKESSGETIVVDGRTFRLPTSRDLARVVEEDDSQAAAVRLLQACEMEGTEASSRDSPLAPLSLEDVEAVSERMARADPLAEITLSFECPNCSAAGEEILDLPAFLWAEIEARAKRLLLEIHTLASAYGWAEPEILAMSDVRRSTYLQMVHA